MGTQDAPFKGDVWFFTSDESGKISEIAHNKQVGLSYSNPDKQSYVSLSGVGTIVRDRAKAEELWTPILKAWFPQGLNDPHLALLRVEVHAAEYWDAPSSKMVNLFHMAKSALTGGGRQEEWGEHGRAKIT